MEVDIQSKKCGDCGRDINLVQTGKETWHWVDRENSWYCGNDPMKPVKVHEPKSEAGVRIECHCGYETNSPDDLDEHVLAMMHVDNGEHHGPKKVVVG